MKIEAKFENFLYPLSSDELQGLEDSLKREGCLDPLRVWAEKDILIDGHNRHKICTRLGIEYKVEYLNFDNDEQVLIWMIANQSARRNTTPEQDSYYRGKRYELEKKRTFHGNQHTDNLVKCQNVTLPEKDTAQQIADEYKTSRRTINRDAQFAKAVDTLTTQLGDEIQHDILNRERSFTKKDTVELAKLVEKEPEEVQEIIENVKTGKVKNVQEAKKELSKKKREAEIQQQIETIQNEGVIPPDGLYDIISIDPPWPYGTKYDPNGRRAANPYPEMSLEEIKAIELPDKDDAILFLWTTHKFMRHSFDLLDNWGYRDVAIITWVKHRMGLGSWLRSQSEFCIMAVKGKPKVNLTNQTTVIHGELREHSRKPDEFYDFVNSLCVGRKLDYFSRQTREGWSSFGNDVAKFGGDDAI